MYGFVLGCLFEYVVVVFQVCCLVGLQLFVVEVDVVLGIFVWQGMYDEVDYVDVGVVVQCQQFFDGWVGGCVSVELVVDQVQCLLQVLQVFVVVEVFVDVVGVLDVFVVCQCLGYGLGCCFVGVLEVDYEVQCVVVFGVVQYYVQWCVGVDVVVLVGFVVDDDRCKVWWQCVVGYYVFWFDVGVVVVVVEQCQCVGVYVDGVQCQLCFCGGDVIEVYQFVQCCCQWCCVVEV